MPALPDDIFAASREAAIATWSDAAIAARYPSARDGSTTPSEGFFDLLADAQAVINARGVLIGREARRFVAVANDLIWPTVSDALPAYRLIDAEQRVDATMIVARMEVNLEAETTTVELFGGYA